MSIYTRLFETGTLDDMVSCPYVPAHVMSANRFMVHVVKCRKQNPKKAEVISECPYNQFHYFHKDDYQKHMATCAQYHHFQNMRLKRGQEVLEIGQPSAGPPVVSVPAGKTKEEDQGIQERVTEAQQPEMEVDDEYAKDWE